MAGKHIEQKPPELSSLTSRHPEIDYLQANWTFQPTAWRVILHMSMDNPPNKEKEGVQFICANVKMPRVLYIFFLGLQNHAYR